MLVVNTNYVSCSEISFSQIVNVKQTHHISSFCRSYRPRNKYINIIYKIYNIGIRFVCMWKTMIEMISLILINYGFDCISNHPLPPRNQVDKFIQKFLKSNSISKPREVKGNSDHWHNWLLIEKSNISRCFSLINEMVVKYSSTCMMYVIGVDSESSLAELAAGFIAVTLIRTPAPYLLWR